jgi:aspartyl-tRNA(Asn)/glutamyl-tRNA(Gln) amidotransferase subunit C
MSLDTATVRRIASLARIRVTPVEVAQLQTELSGILDWIAMLNEANVEGVEPLAGGAQIPLKMRDDVVNDGGITSELLANAPDRAGDYFAVPKVVE